ncbi:YkgJ family cysteine cluster protein [Candidatus Sumerlaeota bacterium]|nr:YkgJ family cysteine cluster protein [Candidatus Sumerlaeota bacterium]
METSAISEAEFQSAIEREFKCNRCGHCCKGDGVVEVGLEEIDRMAAHLGLSRKEFVGKYAVKAGATKWWLIDQKNPERWCIFLTLGPDGLYGCAVNEAKPDQCSSFPAKWRNEDSFRTCAGLRFLMRTLRERKSQVSAAEQAG